MYNCVVLLVLNAGLLDCGCLPCGVDVELICVAKLFFVACLCFKHLCCLFCFNWGLCYCVLICLLCLFTCFAGCCECWLITVCLFGLPRLVWLF